MTEENWNLPEEQRMDPAMPEKTDPEVNPAAPVEAESASMTRQEEPVSAMGADAPVAEEPADAAHQEESAAAPAAEEPAFVPEQPSEPVTEQLFSDPLPQDAVEADTTVYIPAETGGQQEETTVSVYDTRIFELREEETWNPMPTTYADAEPVHTDEEEEQEMYKEERPVKWKMPKILSVLLYFAFVMAMGLGLAYFAWICAGDVFALSKPDREVEITITAEDTVDDVINMLVEEGLVDYEWLFRLYCTLANADEKISEGTFKLNNLFDYNALINGLRVHSGTRETTEVQIPEGYTSQQIFRLLDARGVCTVEELEEAAANYPFDYEFLQELPYGNPNRLEGYLFPDTYEFYIDDNAERVISKLIDNFTWKFKSELQEDITELNAFLAARMRANGFTEAEIAENMMDLHDVVIAASLIEVESGGASESATVASVIYNRLSSKVYPLLEIDESVRYGLGKWDEPLTASDLAADTPYNTRKYPGLPAGPISNPSLDSIRAALYPKDTNYYFYAETSTGFHHFSETYYDHQAYLEEMQNSGN